MKILPVVLLGVLLLMGCGSQSDSPKGVEKEAAVKKNVFHDEVLKTIYTLQNQRDSVKLQVYLKHESAKYRKAAVLGFASVQDKKAVDALVPLLSDQDQGVRSAAAYALGQAGEKSVEPKLIKAFETEKSNAVKRDILEAIGKCGTAKGLEFVVGLFTGEQQVIDLLLEGQAWAIYRFALQPVTSKEGTAKMVELLQQSKPATVRFASSHYLARARKIDLKEFSVPLMGAVTAEKELNTRMAIALALGKAKTPEVLEQLKKILASEEDYRVKVNALRALGHFDSKDVKELLLTFAADKNSHMAVTASEYFLNGGNQEDVLLYFDTAKNITNWRSRANLLHAALKNCAAKDKKNRNRIVDWVQAAYKKTSFNYEKGWLLQVLAWEPEQFLFVQSQMFAYVGKVAVISSNGINALADMFQAAHKAKQLDKKAYETYTAMFTKAIQSGDASLITMAAMVLRNPDFAYKEYIKDTAFLQVAFDNCSLPGDFEAQGELRKTIAYFAGQKESEPVAVKNSAIDWELVKKVSPDHKVLMKTTKGDITLQMMVDSAPGSVVNFLKLIRADYYKKSVFHRVVPNFVAQDGCPRGDGWGGPDYTIGSEFAPLHYEEGSVGMASAGKDTEGSQWFITHSPTPHLDGRYTIFAKVIAGLDIVHKLEIGDKIKGFQEL
jgi:cyclophilin family peptidyl-prolyl cis-trans isomerase/HEAT repeat protein